MPPFAYSASTGRAGQFVAGIGFPALSKNQTSYGKDIQQNQAHCSFFIIKVHFAHSFAFLWNYLHLHALLLVHGLL